MNISYRRELDSNYLVIEDESFGMGQYTLRMLSGNRPEPFLPLSLKQMNGITSLWYKITSMQNMDRIFERHPMGGEDIRRVMEGYRNALESARAYLLETGDIVLDPAYIFLSPDRLHVRFIYVPGREGMFQGSLKNLLEYILRKLDHKDRMAVTMGYGLYEAFTQGDRAFIETWEELSAGWDLLSDAGMRRDGHQERGRSAGKPEERNAKTAGREANRRIQEINRGDGENRGKRGIRGDIARGGELWDDEWEDSLTEDEYAFSKPAGRGRPARSGRTQKKRKGRSKGEREGAASRKKSRDGNAADARLDIYDTDAQGLARKQNDREGRAGRRKPGKRWIVPAVTGTILTGIVFGLIGWFTSLDTVQTGGLFFGTLAAAWLVSSLIRNREDPEKTIWGDTVKEDEEDSFWEALMCGEGVEGTSGLGERIPGNDAGGPGAAGMEYPQRIPPWQNPADESAGQTDGGRTDYLQQIEKEEAWIHGETRALGEVDRRNRLVLVSQDIRRSRDLVLESAITLIGKSREMADVVIPLDVISRVHARMDHTDDGIWLTDLNSMNGTFVNENRLEPNQRVAVAEGDKISFATVHFKLARRDY